MYAYSHNISVFLFILYPGIFAYAAYMLLRSSAEQTVENADINRGSMSACSVIAVHARPEG